MGVAVTVIILATVCMFPDEKEDILVVINSTPPYELLIVDANQTVLFNDTVSARAIQISVKTATVSVHAKKYFENDIKGEEGVWMYREFNVAMDPDEITVLDFRFHSAV